MHRRRPLLVEEKPLPPSEQESVPWTEAEIDAAKAKCKELLTGDPLDYEPLPPDQGGRLRNTGAGPAPRGRHRPEGRDLAAGDHELPDG